MPVRRFTKLKNRVSRETDTFLLALFLTWLGVKVPKEESQ